MLPFALENPLTWVHFQIRGGFRTLITTSIGYTALIVGLLLLSIRTDVSSIGNILYGWTQGLMGLQIGILLLGGGAAIRNAVRKDLATRMIESHRLMPIPASQAIVGYLTGPSFQFLVLALINLGIGCATSAAAPRINTVDWLLANMVLGIFVLCIWFASILSAFLNPGAFVLVLSVVGGTVFSQGALVIALPGLALLTGPMIGQSVFGMIDRGARWDWPLQISSLAELAAAGFCFLGATRKYRREDLLAFGSRMALLLLAGWLGLSAIGISHFSEFRFQMFRQNYGDLQVMVIGTLISSLILAMLPVMSGVWTRRQWLARKLRHDTDLGRTPTAPEMVALSAAAFIALFGLSIRNGHWPYFSLTVAGVALSFTLGITYLLGIIYRGGATRVGLLVSLYIGVTWLMPIGIDGSRIALEQSFQSAELSGIAAFSPLGALILATTDNASTPLPGVIGQFAPVLLLGLFYYRPLRSKGTKAPPAAAPAA